jgi:hypothetical protein
MTVAFPTAAIAALLLFTSSTAQASGASSTGGSNHRTAGAYRSTGLSQVPKLGATRTTNYTLLPEIKTTTRSPTTAAAIKRLFTTRGVLPVRTLAGTRQWSTGLQLAWALYITTPGTGAGQLVAGEHAETGAYGYLTESGLWVPFPVPGGAGVDPDGPLYEEDFANSYAKFSSTGTLQVATGGKWHDAAVDEMPAVLQYIYKDVDQEDLTERVIRSLGAARVMRKPD